MQKYGKIDRFLPYQLFLFIILILFSSHLFAEELASSNSHFYFVQITDTHWGDADHYERTQKAVEMINNLPMPITCIIHTGDITMDKMHDEAVVLKGIHILEALTAPIYFVPGNHDIRREKNDADHQAYAKHFGNLITRAEHHGVVFLLIYTEPLTRYAPPDQFKPLAELEKTLKANRDKPVIVFHHSPSVGDFYNNVMHYRWKKDIQNKWISLLNSFNVKAVIAGHFHRDEHHWLGDVPLYIAPSIAGYWGRQATFRLYEYKDGKISYRTQYIP